MLKSRKYCLPLCLIAALAFAGFACNLPSQPNSPLAAGAPLAAASNTPEPSGAPSLTPTPSATSTLTPEPTTTPSPTPTPYGCETPPDDYTLVTTPVGFSLNQRTLSMLEHAQVLYGGSHDLVRAITQGSYNVGVSASFGTHDAGGAVDIAMRDLADWHHVLYEDADAIILALRRAGFAAWVRDTDSLYPGSPVHIHAIAIGDAELSPAAQSQLTGPEGYFRGFNGLPDNTQPDPHGGPVLCPWMIEMGYADLRSTPSP